MARSNGSETVSLRVMTYNVRSCRGTDGRVSTSRIVDVIARHSPDVIALQELDSGLVRTGNVDQAREIAARLNMYCHFHPSFEMEEGLYGNAIISSHPIEMVSAGVLPTIRQSRPMELRGVIWTRVDLRSAMLDVFTTHLGLNRKERTLQAEEIMGPEWLGNEKRLRMSVFLGDMNVTRQSKVHRMFRSVLKEARHKGIFSASTFPSRFPLLRIDHIFVSEEIIVRRAMVARGPLEASASDHLPVIADIDIPLEDDVYDG